MVLLLNPKGSSTRGRNAFPAPIFSGFHDPIQNRMEATNKYYRVLFF
jgi:hypothetical protein